jgi:hypothetical protein
LSHLAPVPLWPTPRPSDFRYLSKAIFESKSPIEVPASSAKEDLNGLICKLNSYSQPAEVKQ